jgi:hypothetical protein
VEDLEKMKTKIIGILICTLLIVNVSAVLAIPEKKTTSVEKTESFTFVKLFDQANMKYVILDTNAESEIPHENVVGLGPNLMPNPSFEEGDTMPTGWTYSSNTAGIFHWDSNYANSGEKSIGVLGLKKNSSQDEPYINWTTTDFIPVDLRMYSYDVSSWLKSLGTPEPEQYSSILVHFYDENYTDLGWFRVGFHNNYSEWYQDGIGFYNSAQSYEEENQNMKYLIKLELGQYCHTGFEPNSSFESRFDDIYLGVSNIIPNTPIITGKTQGRARTVYDYIITTTDPDQDDIRYHIDWGDNTYTDTDFNKSGEKIHLSHIWGVEGNYRIRIKAIDNYFGLQSYWAILTLTLPCSYKPIPQFLELLFQRFPHTFPILRQLLGY